jgi:hypothetical protein
MPNDFSLLCANESLSAKRMGAACRCQTQVAYDRRVPRRIPRALNDRGGNISRQIRDETQCGSSGVRVAEYQGGIIQALTNVRVFAEKPLMLGLLGTVGKFVLEIQKKAMQAEAPFYLTTGEALFVTGKTLRLLAAEHDCFLLFDRDGTPVLDDQFYEVTADGIVRVE